MLTPLLIDKTMSKLHMAVLHLQAKFCQAFPDAMQWASSVLKQLNIMKIIADHYNGFDVPIVVSVRKESEEKASAPIMVVKRLV